MAAVTTEPAAKQLATFVAKFAPPMQRTIRACRTAMRQRLRAAHELVYDNYNFLVIGYSPTERPSDAFISIAANAKGVTLFFLDGVRLPDPQQMLLGSGKQVRSVRLPSARTLDEPVVVALIRSAVRESDVPFAKTGRGRLIIRSVSGKQRPRR